MAVKTSRGGRYEPGIPRIFLDKFYNKDGGINYDLVEKEWGIKREFIGSTGRQFVFFDTVHGMLTITAKTFKEAWRLAKRRGYSMRAYIKR